MRLFILIMLFSLIYTVSCKNNVKSLTESLGQEVIEIGAPIKELPMGLEEEPSADDDEKKQKPTSNTVLPASKKEHKKSTTPSDFESRRKDVDKIDGVAQDDEEARIEKELAEIYKDTADYKSDSAEEKDAAKETQTNSHEETTVTEDTVTEDTVTEAAKPIARKKTYFDLEPPRLDDYVVHRFRTSIDEISCGNRQKLGGTPGPVVIKVNKAYNTVSKGITIISASMLLFCMCLIVN